MFFCEWWDSNPWPMDHEPKTQTTSSHTYISTHHLSRLCLHSILSTIFSFRKREIVLENTVSCNLYMYNNKLPPHTITHGNTINMAVYVASGGGGGNSLGFWRASPDKERSTTSSECTKRSTRMYKKSTIFIPLDEQWCIIYRYWSWCSKGSEQVLLGHACSKITKIIQRKVHFLYAKNLVPAELPGYGHMIKECYVGLVWLTV